MPLMIRSPRLLAGFTLVELMVALVINALIFIFLLGIFSANLTHYNQILNTNRLNQQLDAIMQIMATDIRRAGYWSQEYTEAGTNTNTNPFQNSGTGTDVAVGGVGNSCITFSYDHNNTGTLPGISALADDDRYGYRLNGTNIQTRPWGATFSCGAAAAAWENMNNSTITISALTFTLNTYTITTGPGAQGITQRSVDIVLTGYITTAPTITKTLTQHVRINNDYFVP